MYKSQISLSQTKIGGDVWCAIKKCFKPEKLIEMGTSDRKKQCAATDCEKESSFICTICEKKSPSNNIATLKEKVFCDIHRKFHESSHLELSHKDKDSSSEDESEEEEEEDEDREEEQQQEDTENAKKRQKVLTGGRADGRTGGRSGGRSCRKNIKEKRNRKKS